MPMDNNLIYGHEINYHRRPECGRKTSDIEAADYIVTRNNPVYGHTISSSVGYLKADAHEGRSGCPEADEDYEHNSGYVGMDKNNAESGHAYEEIPDRIAI